jgi:hypothetical protein
MKKIFVFALMATAALVACNKDPEQKKDTPADTGDVTKVCINEVCGVSGSKGVELYNSDSKEVLLEGVTLIKNEAADATWTGTSEDKIPAKGFFVIKSKKETTNIDAVANATAKDSFSPGQTLKLELKDAKGNVISTFTRGTAPWSTVIEAVTYSFGHSKDGGTDWKFLDITIGATNNSAAQHGDVTANPAS